jgi:hypothetical protein
VSDFAFVERTMPQMTASAHQDITGMMLLISQMERLVQLVLFAKQENFAQEDVMTREHMCYLQNARMKE